MRGASRNRPRRLTTFGGTRRRREKRKKKRGRRRSRRRETRTRRRGRDEWRRSRSRRGERRESVALAEWTIDGRSPAARVARGVSTQTPSVGEKLAEIVDRRASPPAASDSRCESASGFVGVRVWIWPFGRAATFTRARNGTSGSQSPSPGLDRPHALSRTRPFRADDARVRFGTFHEFCSATTAPAAPTPWREDSAASSPRKRT